MNIIIAGGRFFNDYELLKKECDKILENMEDILVISGKAPGTDTLGERYAKERGYDIKEFPAPWDDIEGKPEHEIKTNKYGKKYWVKAGYYRNELMARVGNMLIAFWDGKSRGTKNMIDLARGHGLKIHVIYYK